MSAPLSPRFREAPLWQVDAAGLGACAILALVWYFAGLQPISEARASRDTLEAQLAEREDAVTSLYQDRSGRQTEINELEAQLDRAAVQMKPAEHVNTRVQELNRLAAGFPDGDGGAPDLRLRVDEIQPGAPKVLSRYTTVPIRLAGRGSYAACTRFLHDLKRQFPDTGIVGFELRSEPDSPDKPPYFSFNLLWYAAPAAPPAPAARAGEKPGAPALPAAAPNS